MPRDLEEELAVASRVEQLTFGRPAKWKPTKDERPGVEGQVLGSFLPLLADEANGFEERERACGDGTSEVGSPKQGALLCENCAKSVWN